MTRFEHGPDNPDTIPTGMQPLDYHQERVTAPRPVPVLKWVGVIVGLVVVVVLILRHH